ncbi:hypothetical protein LTR41_008802 [Exophiala xenobiotica]|nr:hypothetical protein LTR41_008802 [Exophiala xenobiotica]KAK5413484.1 hypothetical protein LTR06_004911 [Exophiala xenobiotica]
MALTRKKSFKFSNEMVTLLFEESSFCGGKIVVHEEVLTQSTYFKKRLATQKPTSDGKAVWT